MPDIKLRVSLRRSMQADTAMQAGGKGQRAPNEELVTLVEKRFQHPDLGGHLAAADDGHEGPCRGRHCAVQEAQLLKAWVSSV